MKTETFTLINGVWVNSPPTESGQTIRVVNYFSDGSYGTLEYFYVKPTEEPS